MSNKKQLYPPLLKAVGRMLLVNSVTGEETMIVLFICWCLLYSECIALYNYTGEVGDLSFKEGDVINVHKDEGEWWEGSCKGEQGLFPANYVKKKEVEVCVFTELSLVGCRTVIFPLKILGARGNHQKCKLGKVWILIPKP